MSFLEPHSDKIYAALRIITGLLFLQHGFQKIFGLFGGSPEGAPPFIQYGAGGIELIGSAMVAVGFLAGPAAFICSGTMAVAYFMAHWGQTGEFWPILNGGELSVLYCFVFLLIAAKGSGIWSVDDARA